MNDIKEKDVLVLHLTNLIEALIPKWIINANNDEFRL